MKLLVTGGSGFIGSHLIDFLVEQPEVEKIINLDALTYAGNRQNNAGVAEHPKYHFLSQDQTLNISQRWAVEWAFREHPDITHVFHLAAESHVDRSIQGPAPFISTNIQGTFNLLEICRERGVERFLYVSTDEVYGPIERGTATESALFRPSSPYAASKAAADLLVQSYVRTYRFPALIVRPSNTYGPRQYPEKLIPLAIKKILAGQPVPIYGDGQQQRQWLYVQDLVDALWAVMTEGQLGEAYNVPGEAVVNNLDLVTMIHNRMGMKLSVEFVTDRPGHDRRYAMDGEKISDLWGPDTYFSKTLDRTVDSYVEKWWLPGDQSREPLPQDQAAL